MAKIYRSPEPFRLEGHGELANTVLLMIHGFTGTPSEFRRLGYYLNDIGYTIVAPLLPGHGTTPEDMIRTGWYDWSSHVLNVYDELCRQPGRRIIVIGHSMGGLLALLLSLERAVEGVVSLATPIFLTSRKAVLAVLLQYFIKYIKKRPAAAEHILEEACTYRTMPVPCIVDLRRLLKLVKSSLSKVRVPVFVAQGAQDGLVSPRSADYIFAHVASPLRLLTHYRNTSHAILLDRERDRVYEDIHRFLVTLHSFGTCTT